MKTNRNFFKKVYSKRIKRKKFPASYGFTLVGNKGNLFFKDYEDLIEAEYENISFVMNTKTNELTFPDEKAEKIEEVSKYFFSLIQKAKEYVRGERFGQVERILKKTIETGFSTEFSQMLEKLKDVNF